MHLLNPANGLNVPDPDAGGTGFQFLGILGRRLMEPAVLAREALPLLVMGGMLGVARWRTASLWLPVGLYGGWKLADGCLVQFTRPIAGANPLAALMAGASLMQGLIPMAGVLVAGALACFLADPARKAAPDV
jgi:hypothetical protein